MHLPRLPLPATLGVAFVCAFIAGCSSPAVQLTSFSAMATTQSVELTGGIVPATERFTFDLPLVFTVAHLDAGTSQPYDLLLAPLPSGGEASAQFLPSDSEIEVFEGFGYFLGKHPRARTRRVIAAGQGTTMLVQVEENIERIYFFEGTRVDVKTVTSTSNTSITQPDFYVEATGGNGTPINISAPKQIPSNSSDPIRQFVVQAMQQAKKANLATPSGW